MLVKDEVVGVAVEFFKAEGGCVAVVDFVHGGGEGGEGCLGGGGVHLGVGAEGLDGEFALGGGSPGCVVVVVVHGHGGFELS